VKLNKLATDENRQKIIWQSCKKEDELKCMWIYNPVKKVIKDKNIQKI